MALPFQDIFAGNPLAVAANNLTGGWTGRNQGAASLIAAVPLGLGAFYAAGAPAFTWLGGAAAGAGTAATGAASTVGTAASGAAGFGLKKAAAIAGAGALGGFLIAGGDKAAPISQAQANQPQASQGQTTNILPKAFYNPVSVDARVNATQYSPQYMINSPYGQQTSSPSLTATSRPDTTPTFTPALSFPQSVSQPSSQGQSATSLSGSTLALVALFGLGAVVLMRKK